MDCSCGFLLHRLLLDELSYYDVLVRAVIDDKA